MGEQLFFFVTYLASLTLLINGTMAEYVIVKLGLVRDPQQPLDLFTTFIRGRMANGVRNHLVTYFKEAREELGDFDYAELKKLCPAMADGGDRTDGEEDAERRSMIHTVTVNPLLVTDMQIVMKVSVEEAEVMAQRFAPLNRTEVDSQLLEFTRATFLQVRAPALKISLCGSVCLSEDG